MKIKNKPLIDKLWDGNTNFLGAGLDFNDVAPKGKTQIFVMSPETSLAAEKLARSPTFKFPPIEDVHLPYQHTVVEIILTEEVKALRKDGLYGTDPITRVGAYLQCSNTEPRAVLCTPFWEYESGQVQASAFTFIYGGVIPDSSTLLLNTKNTTEGAIKIGIIPNLAVIKSMQRNNVPPEHLAEIMKQPQTEQHIRESAVELPLFMFACSMLLTCKSGVTKTEVKPRTPNIPKLGAYKRKQLTSSGYTVMHITAMENVNPDDGAITAKHEMSAHYVRGHFKQRRSGVYWWNPFVRGTGEPRSRTGYFVKE